MDKSPKTKRVPDDMSATKSSVVPSLPTIYETEIAELKEAVIRKDGIIQEQKRTIDQLAAERDELARWNERFDDWQIETDGDRKLLAILLECETVRIKNLLEVG